MSQNLRRLPSLLFITSLLVVAACGGKGAVQPDSATENTPTVPAAEDVQTGDSDSGRAMGLETVHFPYDSFVMDDQAKATLDANAMILQTKSSLRVQIEGHCDQRGGIQYNIALGEKRADAVMKYLSGKGISADRLSTISYGKERPLDPATNEQAYGKNRRANFVITSK